jgi:hypothetical protein
MTLALALLIIGLVIGVRVPVIDDARTTRPSRSSVIAPTTCGVVAVIAVSTRRSG